MPPETQKYFRNVITVEVLSAQPLAPGVATDLDALADLVRNGRASAMATRTVPNEPVNRARMTELLAAQGYDTSGVTLRPVDSL